MIRRYGEATQFVFGLDKEMRARDAFLIGKVNSEMMERREMKAKSTVHLEEISNGVGPYEGYMVLTIAGNQLDSEAFILANVVSTIQQNYEYIGAVVRSAE
jgi:hypothetical protein